MTMTGQTAYGWVQIGGEKYENDIIVHVDGSVSKRHKKLSKDLRPEYGHTPLSEHELDFLKEEKPRTVIIGIGQDGLLPVTPNAQKLLEKYKTVYLPTPGAVEMMSKEKTRYVAIIHVTC
jgi:hypothetical protein